MEFLEKLKEYTERALKLLSDSFEHLKDIDFPTDFILEEKIDRLTGQIYMLVTYKIIDEEYFKEVYKDANELIAEIQTILNDVKNESAKKIIDEVAFLLKKINSLER